MAKEHKLVIALGIIEKGSVYGCEDMIVHTDQGPFRVPGFPIRDSREGLHKFIDAFFDELEKEDADLRI